MVQFSHTKCAILLFVLLIVLQYFLVISLNSQCLDLLVTSVVDHPNISKKKFFSRLRSIQSTYTRSIFFATITLLPVLMNIDKNGETKAEISFNIDNKMVYQFMPVGCAILNRAYE